LQDDPSREDPAFFKAPKEQMQRQQASNSDFWVFEILSSAVDKLMVNTLVLDQTGWAAGEGGYQDYFLCADIFDEDMPWNPDAIDY
jgi:hypothetical protein